MTGHKKQRGWRGPEEYGEIERVRPQHLPRVTTSPQGVLTTAVLAVHCSACLTSTHRAGPRHTAAEDTFKCKERESRVGCEVRCKPHFFLCLSLAVVFYFTTLLSSPSDYFSCHFCCAELEQLNGSNNFQQNFLITRKPFQSVLEATKVFLVNFLKTLFYQQNKWRHKHFFL